MGLVLMFDLVNLQEFQYQCYSIRDGQVLLSVAVTKTNCSPCTSPLCQWRAVSRHHRIYMQWANLTTWRAFQKHDGPLSTTDEHTNHISTSKKRRVYLLKLFLELAETSVSQKKRCSHTTVQSFTHRDSEIVHRCCWTFPQVLRPPSSRNQFQ